jgi:ATP-dependent DNA helicase DinG
LIRLGAAATAFLGEEISRADGNEVCFVGTLDDSGEVVEARVVARGHSTAVLALVDGFEAGEILLHNHPSGALTPSHADLGVAERLWASGLGFAIINNAATLIYVVTAPPTPRRVVALDPAEIDADLAPDGPIARAHPAYEDRPGQREFSRLVGRLFSQDGIGMVEAGTGIGKSAAYLVPAIRWAVQNREVTVVSTNTINLQEQLVRKDLPFLRKALDLPFRWALVKGRNNYVSIRRAKQAMLNAASLFPDNRAEELAAIEGWLEHTDGGTLSDLTFRPTVEVWDEVMSDTEACLRAKCPHFENCFYQRARRDAATADILVVNHHLLFSDLAVREEAGNFDAPAVLPHYKRLVLDEAHNVEEVATSHMGATLSRRAWFRTLGRLEHRGKGLLPAVEATLAKKAPAASRDACLALVQQRIRPELEAAWKRGAEVFRAMGEVARTASGAMVRLTDEFAEDPIWQTGLEEDLSATIAHLDTIASGLQLLRERLDEDEATREEHEEIVLELRAVTSRVMDAMAAFRAVLRPEPGGREAVRWVEWRPSRDRPGDEAGAGGNVVLAAAPLKIAGVLRDTLFERVPTVVLTSATLATQGGFAYSRERIGLEGRQELEEAVFPSPFNFDEQSLLAVPTDLPVPIGMTAGRHARATELAVGQMAELSDGGVFVLFTSHQALTELAVALRRSGIASRWPLFVQGEDAPRRLVERFVDAGRGILLGTNSFWEGVDVPGDPLRGIVIPKLPFKVPTEPITAARIEAIEAEGGDSFNSYMLPSAAIRLKQGFGRLIRSRMDRGAVLLLDPRIVQKRYGRFLLDSLPPARRVIAPWKECKAEMENFYSRG